MTQLLINDAADRIHKYAKEDVNNFADGDEQRTMLIGARRYQEHQTEHGSAAQAGSEADDRGAKE